MQGHLRIHAVSSEDNLVVRLAAMSYDVSTTYLESIANTFDTIVTTITRSPHLGVADLNYMSPGNEQLIKSWNQNFGEQVDQCVHEIVYEQVLKRPEHEAVCAWDRNFTYRELWRYVQQLAQILSDAGVGPNDLVPLCFQKSAWAVIAMLATMEVGAGFCPLDASQPKPRLQKLATKLDAKVLLCSANLAKSLDLVTNKVIPVDAVALEGPRLSLHLRKPRATPFDVAYVLWTSGSTGEPKGIVIEHRAYSSAAKAHAPALFMDSDSRILQYSSYVFDASIIEILTPLMLGATVCVPSEHSRMNDLPAAIRKLQVDWAVLTPSVVNFLVPSTVPGLKTLLLVGEVMSHENILTWSGIKLLNAYGPAECSVAAAANPEISYNKEPTLIGRGIGVKTWLTDPDNHDRLCPPGCIGELLIEGPTLARGYLKDPDRSQSSFIEDPAWATTIEKQPYKRRLYKTGDLARYQISSGLLYFVGRKDTQVKLHGQRIELGEIEHHVTADSTISQSMIILPKTGVCSQRLVAVVSFDALSQQHQSDASLQALDKIIQSKAKSLVSDSRIRLSDLLQTFMLPSIWLVVNQIPLLQSGKLDRKRVFDWAQALDSDTISSWAYNAEENEEQPATQLEAQLREIWANVLNIKVSQISLQQSFLDLGGDSISAMMVQSHCKRSSIGITVQDILRSKSIGQLALFARIVARNGRQEDKIETDFDLSPIQRLYFDLPDRKGYFNQSFFVRSTETIQPAALKQALIVIVNRHSMLRSRFRFSAFDDEWKQRITTDVAHSFAFRVHACESIKDTSSLISKSQLSLDPIHGPLFAVELFNVADGTQLLFMTGHHLVIDLVSWRIILHDLEELIRNPKCTADPSLSFQTWCQMQVEHAHRTPLSTVLLDVSIPAQSFSYWGMEDKPNLYGDVVRKGFELDVAATAMISYGCHGALRTETLDVLLAALIQSFSQVFSDRLPPTIFNEGHGREAWDENLDLSGVVGWFTTMYPIYIASSGSSDFLETLRRVKDYRRAVPSNGRNYFASRLLTSKGAKRFGTHWPLELVFNYLGRYQQLERKNALFLPVEEMAGEARGAGGNADVGHDTPRFGLFEISAVIASGKLRFSFTFNRHMKQQEKTMEWISKCLDTLQSVPPLLARMQWRPTLSDFPLLSLTYDQLEQLVTDKFPRLGIIDLKDVEDIYPCSQIQQGLMISKQRDTGLYAIEVTYQVNSKDGVPVEKVRLASAWQQVIDRHASLRTLVVDSLGDKDSLYDQIVLRKTQALITYLYCQDESDLGSVFNSQPSMEDNDRPSAHRLTICETSSGKIFCRMEISHVLVDGASLSIIFQEVVSLYEGKSLCGNGPLYSNYLAFLQNMSPQAGVGYWASYLADIEPTTFPILNDSNTADRSLHSLHINWDDFENLQNFCNLHAVTMANVFYTAWALTLQCYTGSQDVCFGYLMSVRDDAVPDVGDLVGYLVNMLVCRVILDPATPLITIMQQVQTDLSEGQDHRHTALSEVLHALKVSGVALFNTSLSYRKLPLATAGDHHTISFDEFEPYYDPTEYSASVNIEVSEENAAIDLDYWTDCLSDGHAANVAGTFRQALKNIVDQAEESVGQLSRINEHDRLQILAWNSKMPPTIERCVHDVVSEQAALHPEAPAICAWDANLTYATLDKLSERLAEYLCKSLGVGPETYVCLCFEKSAFTIVAQLAVLKAGGAFVSLDPMHPIAALELRIKDTQAKAILTSPCFEAIFTATDCCVLSVEQNFLEGLQPTRGQLRAAAKPYNPCCVIYTSGSTGKPKGVVLEHQALVTSLNAHGAALGISQDTRFLQYSSYTFDNSLEEVFTTLSRGGTVCVPSDHDRMNDLAGAVSRLGANFMDLTPTVANYLKPSDMPTIKTLALGGEALTKTVLEVWGDEVILHNQYGPSECSINATHRTDLHKSSDPSSIGRSVGSVSWIVDPSNHDRLMAIGSEGELVIEGPILARGYLKNPEKTSEVFVEDPAWITDCSGQQGQPHGHRRMYKTGDLVRYNSDGTFAYIGRKDQQVKLNGQRIELGEIEYHIKSQLLYDWHFAVELIQPGSGTAPTKSLALFICPNTSEETSATMPETEFLPVSTILQTTFKDLESSLAKAVPKHMVPSLYVPMARLPLTTSGKLDRRRLRATADSMTSNQVAMFRLATSSGHKPSTDMEKILADMWETVLSLEAGSVGMNAQFFRLGGDSIAAIQLVTAARSKGISLTVANVFRNATLAEMCNNIVLTGITKCQATQPGPEPFTMLPQTVSSRQLMEEVSKLCKVDTKELEDIYPCTAMQEGLVASSGRLSGAYVARNVYHLGAINIDRFKRAWETVVAEETILRTRIVYTDSSGFLQAVVDESIAWNEVEQSEDVHKDGDMIPSHNGGNLTKYNIIKDNDNIIFVWAVHHALYDGWSVELILNKVQKLYETPERVESTKETAYSRFIQYLSSVNVSEAEDFWRSRLAGTTTLQYPPLPKPTYQPRGSCLLTHAVSISLKAENGITIPSMIRAAWALTIATYSDSEDVVFAETATGRDAPLERIEDIAGPTFATVPVRIRAETNLTVADYLQHSQQDFMEALPFQHIGLQRIKRINEDSKRACNFQNLIAINTQRSDTRQEFWNLQSSGDVNTDFFTYALTVAFDASATEVRLSAHYDPGVLSQWQLKRFAQYFSCVLTRMNSSKSSYKLRDMLSLPSEDEASIALWNSQVPKSENRSINNMIFDQGQSRPSSSPAVCGWDAKFTYRELDQASTHLACHLHLKGIARGHYVPICFDKSASAVVSMIALLKVGAAFVAIDHESPRARLEGIIEDLDAKHVLCSFQYQRLCNSLGMTTIIIENESFYKTAPDSYTFEGGTGDDIAYIVFTSGSTGKPKGTLVSHSAFVSGALAHGPAMRMNSASRVFQFASYTFDASIMEVFTTLILGGCVCVADNQTRLNEPAKAINEMEVNWALLTPSFVQLLNPLAVPTLKTLVLGGEAMSQSNILAWSSNVHLINAYGPSECAVVATVNTRVSPSSDPSNIGRAVGSCCFIANQDNHHEPVPVGAPGELIVVGPILAKGYLKNPTKTSESFVLQPLWTRRFCESPKQDESLAYKTGDLVKYAEDGSFIYIGRKDNQTKIHGQRLELGEVEHHLQLGPGVKHALAFVPSRGFYENRLVAIVSLKHRNHSTVSHRNLELIAHEGITPFLRSFRDHLGGCVPPYMIPSNWVVVQEVPLMPSGKLDRRRMISWVEDTNEAMSHELLDTDVTYEGICGSETERRLVHIWSKVLRMSPQHIDVSQNFLFLGGDSISALQVVSQCRAESIGVTIQDVMQSHSLSNLASRATLPLTTSYGDEELDTPFALSPMQQLFFDWVGDDFNHFNQSIICKVTRRQDPSKILAAVTAFVSVQSMLRGRFEKTSAGDWMQRLDREPSKSFRFTAHVGSFSIVHIKATVDASQKGLDIQRGPLFAIDLFESDENNMQVLSLAIHHLVIDVVSWTIVLSDLEDYLLSGKLPMPPQLPFQVWSHLQAEHAQSTPSRGIHSSPDNLDADYAYWGMVEKPNTYGSIIDAEFEINAETTKNLLGPCHDAYHTEVVDVLLASILHSFRQTFPDRENPPLVFNEAHGREAWGSTMDLSHTVGWFTTIYPVFTPLEAAKDDDVANIVRWVKELRSRATDRGRQYFAWRMLTEEGRKECAKHWPMEIAFNYLGQEKQFKQTGSLLEVLDEVSSHSDIGATVPRFSLFEITASVIKEKLKVSFTYPRSIQRQHGIKKWLAELEKSLHQTCKRLLELNPQPTQSDFPLLPLGYNHLEKLRERLACKELSVTDVEDVYGCSSMQQGLLLSQIKDPGHYMYHSLFSVQSVSPAASVDAKKLVHAWKQVVQKHPSLRTVFIDSLSHEGLKDQVVLKTTSPKIVWLRFDTASEELDWMKEGAMSFEDTPLCHQLSICERISGDIICKLELSHAICDGTSIAIIFHDLARFYAAKEVQFNKVPIYRNYISHLRDRSHEQDIAYWRHYLEDVEPCSLPALVDGLKHDHKLQTLDLNLSNLTQLKTFCAHNSVTLSNVLQLVWSLVLRAYTGSDRICFGYLSSGRDVPVEGIQDAVGLFISMLVCRIDLRSDLLLQQALKQIQSDYTRSMAHQALSLGEMQHELQLSGKALFNTAFTFQKRRDAQDAQENQIVIDIFDSHDPSEYDLTVNVEAREASIAVQFSYWADYLSESQARNISDTFNQTLQSVLDSNDAEQKVESVEYCSDKHRQQIMEWNNEPLPKIEKCVHDLIYEQSQKLPIEAPAICSWDVDLTYVKLMALSKRLAKQLATIGAGPENYIPICFEKSTWAVVAMLGILQAGSAFVPLEPSHPDSRIKFILNNINAKLIICSTKYREKFEDLAELTTFVLDETTLQGKASTTQLTTKPSPANAAYLIFTSGTTGLPKGTIVSHQAFATSAISHAPAILMEPSARVLQFSNLCFDASVMEILTSLITGACVCIPSEEERINDIAGAINRMSVSWTLLTPSVANVLKPESVPTLKVLVTGGEAMQAGHISKWIGKTSLVNAYGPTESAVIATASIKVDRHHTIIDQDPTNIGHAVGCRAWLVNPQNYNQIMPIGSVGELVVQGNSLAQGYLNNEKKTAESFVFRPTWMNRGDDELVQDHHKLIYKTGDLVRYNSDGSILYIARKDTQIKFNGLRIELGEVEHHVKSKLPAGFQVAAELVAPAGQQVTLALFSVSPDDLSVANEDKTQENFLLPMPEKSISFWKTIKASLGGALPAYMIPSLYIPLKRMPWTPSGKLDRSKISRSVATLSKEEVTPYRLASSNRKRAPATESEKRLQKLWECVLSLDSDSVTGEDSFFVLGGDSVQAMRLVAAARSERVSLSVLDIFRSPTLSEMAKTCGCVEEENDTVQKPFGLLTKSEPLDEILDEIAAQTHQPKEQVVDAYPCSALQEGLIALSIKQTGAYISHNVFRLPEAVELPQFKAAWVKTIAEIDILRTRIVHTSTSNFVQVVLREEDVAWNTAQSTDAAIQASSSIPDNSGSPLMRFTIVDDNNLDGRFFVWSIHHALYDGWSMPRMLQRVEETYFETSSQPPKISYSQFIEYLSHIEPQASEQFWGSAFQDMDAVHFPQVDQSLEQDEGSSKSFTHKVTLTHKASGTGVTLPTVIKTAWAILLSARTGSQDVLFGETLTGRDVPVDGILEMLGPTLTTVPTRIKIDATPTVMGLLTHVRQMSTEVIPYQHVGLQNIRKLSTETAAACNFNNLLVIQTTDGDTIEGKLWEPQNTGVGSTFFTYPLVAECRAEGSNVHVDVHYNDKHISEWHTQTLIHQFETLLQQLCAVSPETDIKISDLKVLSGLDIKSIQEWNNYQPAVVSQRIHDLFLMQAKLTPKAEAVCSWDGSFSYQELKTYAYSFSRQLMNMGVAPEVLVPFCMDRSRRTIVAQMAVLLADGALVPLDPSHPVSRHSEIINDTKATMMLCSPQYRERYLQMVDIVVAVDEYSLQENRVIPAPDTFPAPRSTCANTAYVIFTSGSTGRPKGVVVEHRAFCTSSQAFCRAMLMDASSRVFNFASVTFDVGLMENISPLTLGACVCVPNNERKLLDTAAAVRDVRATWAFLTPSVASLIEPSSVTCLRTLVCGGEAMSKETVLKWSDKVQLVNGYGPTEAAVISVANSATSRNKDASNIGFATANCHAWIADQSNQDRLAPLGSAGELLLEGPILAREYLHDKEKTAVAFIINPKWVSYFSVTKQKKRRFYKTGDLVRYNDDGSIKFVGRKDNQIKLHGNRIELGEIEHSLEQYPQIIHGVALLPKKGLCKGRLVGVFSLADSRSESKAAAARECTLLKDESQITKAQEHVGKIREVLLQRLPEYMIPALWIPLEAIPLLVSGKLDRKQVERWVENIDTASYQSITAEKHTGQEIAPMTETVQHLLEIWSAVFNVSTDQINPSQSFMSQGGDSLISMTIIARCRKIGISLTLKEVLQSKSLFQLGVLVDSRRHSMVSSKHLKLEEQTEQSFDLSPIQKLYFQLSEPSSDHTKEGRFNQSQLLRITRKTNVNTLKNVIDAIVQQHSMFRARFFKDKAGLWQQKIVRDAASSYKFREHFPSSVHDMIPVLAKSQTSLNLESGPLFAVELFNNDKQGQVLSLVAHHLVIDVVSWNVIIQELEDLLTFQIDTIDKPLSFQVWCALQKNHALQRNPAEVKSILPFNIKRGDMAFWGMVDQPNRYGDVNHEGFMLDNATTQLALGSSNAALHTQPIDLVLAAMIHSFRATFPHRASPTIFNESHGRDAWDSSIDLTSTTGWFTCIAPVHMAVENDETSLVDILRRVKDLRRGITSNGRDYFAHRYLTSDGRWRFGDHMPMEILLNYTGQAQQAEHSDSLLHAFELPRDEKNEKLIADVGPQATRMALFEVSAGVSSGLFRFSFMYNKHMQHQSEIQQWVAKFQGSLKNLVTQTAGLSPLPTLSDYPLLPTTYDGLSKRVTDTFREIGIANLDEVEDMFLCAPTQEGLLLSQIRNPDQYINFVISEVTLAQQGSRIDVPRLVKAWQQVVDRHQSLRTAFVYSVCKGHAFDQIVLRKVNGGAKVIRCDDSRYEREFGKISLKSVNSARQPQLPHQFSICTTNTGKCYVKLELNHAVIDGGSGAIITRDLKLAYENRLDDGPPPLYSDYIQYISSRTVGDADINYWKQFMKGVERCHLPPQAGVSGSKKLNAFYMKFDRFGELQSFCRNNELTLSNVMLAGWALVLRQYMSRDDVCFGNLTAGRDAPVENIQNTVGAFINMLVCRVNVSSSSSLKNVFHKVQSDYLDALPYQHCSLAKLQHDLGLGGEQLFNTAVSIQNQISTRDAEKEGDVIDIEPITDHDPTEYAVTVNIRSAPGDEGVRIKHWTSHVSVKEGEKLGQAYADVLGLILDDTNQTVQQLDDASRQPLQPKTPEKQPMVQERRLDKGPVVEKRKIDPLVGLKDPKEKASERKQTHEATVTSSSLADQSNQPPPMYRNIVKECIHEVIEQMFVSGEFISFMQHKDQLKELVKERVEGQRSPTRAPKPSSVGTPPPSSPGPRKEGGPSSKSAYSHHYRSSSAEKHFPKENLLDVRPPLFRNPSSAGSIMTTVSKEIAPASRPRLRRNQSSTGPDGHDGRVSLARPKLRRNPSSRGPEPLQKTTTTLRALWSPLLNVQEDEIRTEDSFFLLGGDSILAMELARSARDVGLTLTVADIFVTPILGEMAQVIINNADSKNVKETDLYLSTNGDALAVSDTANGNTEPGRFSLLKAANTEAFIQDYICPKIGVFRGGVVDVLPVTDFQALAVTGTLVDTMWMLNFITFDGQGLLDMNRFRRSAFKLLQQFDILRTVFVPCGDRFLQVILRTIRPSVDVYETEEDLDTFSRELQHRSQITPPRLGESYVQFIVIKKSGSRKHRIILRLSHAQYDGICLPKILQAFQAGYEGKSLTPSPPFSNYIAQATGIASQDHYDYWKVLLRGSSMTHVVQREQPSYGASDPSMITLKRDIKLKPLSSKNITHATILKAAWILVLAQLSGRSDIVFGNLISGRNADVEGIESIVGPCLNIIPVRIKLEPRWTGLDLLRKIQHQQVVGMPFESLGFREIVQHCTDWPEWTYFSSIVQHQNIAQDMPFKLDRIKYKLGFLGAPDTLADLTIVSTPKENDMVEIALGYADDRAFPQSFAERALDMIITVAQGLFNNPGTMIPSQSSGITDSQLPQVPEDTPSITGSHVANKLRRLRKRDILDMADTLTRAWRMVLPIGKQNDNIVDLDSSFHDLGGDLISLASLAAFLDGEGYNIRLEDLMKRPTLGEQIALLSTRRTETANFLQDTITTSLPEHGIHSIEKDSIVKLEEQVMPTEQHLKKKSVWKRSLGFRKRKTNS